MKSLTKRQCRVSFSSASVSPVAIKPRMMKFPILVRNEKCILWVYGWKLKEEVLCTESNSPNELGSDNEEIQEIGCHSRRGDLGFEAPLAVKCPANNPTIALTNKNDRGTSGFV